MHWGRKWQPTPTFLPGESQGWGAWWAAVYGVTQNRTRLKRLSSSSSSRCVQEAQFSPREVSLLFAQARKLALQNILLKTKCETKPSSLVSSLSALLLSLALVKLLEPPSEIMRFVPKGRTFSTAESGLYIRLGSGLGETEEWVGGSLIPPHKAISVCRRGRNRGFGDRGHTGTQAEEAQSLSNHAGLCCVV